MSTTTSTGSSIFHLDFNSTNKNYFSSKEYVYKWTFSLFLIHFDFEGSFTVNNESDEKSPWQITIFSDKLSNKDYKDFLSMNCFFNKEALQIVDDPQSLIIYIVDKNGVERIVYSNFFIEKPQECKWEIKKFLDKKNVFDYKNSIFENSDLILKFKISFPCKLTDSKCSQKLFSFENMLNNEEFSDMKIAVGDKTFYVHKLILASQSPVFAAMFKHNMKEKNENIVEISDVTYEVMEEMLRFIYAGKVNNIETIASDLLIAADKYGLQELKIICEHRMSSYLSMETVASALIFAEKYRAKILKEKAITFFLLHAKEIVQTEKYSAELNSLSPLLSDIIKALVMQRNKL